MRRIGLLSDTHSHWDERYLLHFKDCDEIWHAGDIGSMDVANHLAEYRPLRAVCGNCDGGELHRRFPEVLRFQVEDCHVLMKHIGGYPGNYDPSVKAVLYSERPQLFVSGHSHILKVKYDAVAGIMHMNPGAAGLQGWQQVRTLIRFCIDGNNLKDLEVIELA